MRLTLAEPRFLKESISIISDLVNEARFKVNPNAIELVAMDPANVAMVVFKLLSSSFTEYRVEKDAEIAINLGSLKQVLRRANPNDMLSLDLEQDKLRITLKGTTTRTFNLPIIELDERDQKVPDLKFSANVRMPCTLFNEAVADADVVAESVSFVADSGTFTILAEGDLSQAKIEIAEDKSTKISSSDKVKAKYSLEYLKKMIGGSKLSDEVEIHFGNDYPLKLEYKTVDKVMLSFILAPRVEND